ncbi:MAG TPA: hypothetical protein VL492_03860 [Methylovirgula sp.]|nr:hypothetical protein [Methylovirgula sp.]
MPNDMQDITDDSNQQFVSIHVPNTQDGGAPNYHYLRLGMADNDIEPRLPADPNDPSGATNGTSVPDAGISLFTTGSYTISAPSINSWSSDSLTAVINGNDLYTASYTTSPRNGMRPATVTFQNVDQMTNTAAASTNFLNGDALTYWNGNDQSLGIGGLLWANYGLTTNLFGGFIVNLTNTSAELQGFGSYKVEQSAGISAAEEIVFAVSPLAGGFDDNIRMITILSVVMATLTALTTAMNAAMTAEMKLSGHDEASLKKMMQVLYLEQITATSLVTVVQAMSILVAIKIKLIQAAAGASLASITMNDTGVIIDSPLRITLSCGPSRILVSPFGIDMVGPTGIAGRLAVS